MAAKYFYVKNSLGTRTSGGGLSKQTGSFTTLGATNVYATIAAVLADAAPPVAGDFILISAADAYTQASALSYTFVDGTFLESVSDSACDTYSKGATQSTTGSASSISLLGQIYSKGISFVPGSSGNAVLNITSSATGNQKQIWEDCYFQMNTTGTAAFINIGGNANSVGNAVDWRNVDVKFGATAQLIRTVNSVFNWVGGSILSGSSAVTSLFNNANTGRGSIVFCGGVDLSNAATALNIFTVGNGPSDGTVANCELPASWSGGLTTGTMKVSEQYRLINTDDANTDYIQRKVTAYGSSLEDTSHYLTGTAATDGTTSIGWAINTTSAAGVVNGGFVSLELPIPVTSTGSKTFSIELLTDGTLTDQDVALDLLAMENASFPLGTYTTSQSDPLSSPSNLTAGAGTGSWNSTTGPASPTSSKISLTRTINQVGIVMARLRVMKPSITLYVNPDVTVA